jgi:predicted Rossmann fold flavoprotein
VTRKKGLVVLVPRTTSNERRTTSNTDIIVIGAGAAGMLAAYTAARVGARVLVLERNRTAGRKLLITGSGRCNLTNRTDTKELVAQTPGNGRFLYSVFERFGAADLMRLFETELGVPLKVERGRRVFPVSDQSRDIVNGLERGLRKLGVQILTGQRVAAIVLATDGRVAGVKCETGERFTAPRVIVATGGASYPGTGSTGDGYRLARTVGHTLVPPFPALVPLETVEDWPRSVEGLTLTNVNVTSYYGDKKLEAEFGDLLFTGFGVSGPIILSLSRRIAPLVTRDPAAVTLRIDLKPALTVEAFDRRLQKDFTKFIRKVFKNALDELLPKSLIPALVDLAQIDPLKPVHQITKEERRRLVRLFKQLTLTVQKARPLAEAIVTAGGVATKELNPKTLESKLISGLYFAGEVVDVDAYTGGYNLQIAFSTGYAAGMAAAGEG